MNEFISKRNETVAKNMIPFLEKRGFEGYFAKDKEEAKKIAAVRDVIYPQFSDVEIRKGQGDSSNEEFSMVGGLREYPIGPDGAV